MLDYIIVKRFQNLIRLFFSSAASMLIVSVVFVSTLQAQNAFEDVTESVGLTGLSGSVAAWGDYNNDGWVDLFVGGQLWKNETGKRFSKVEIEFPGPGIWGDFDNDGHLDLFCWSGKGKVFRNLDGKSFEDIGAAFPNLPTQVSLGATWGDFNGDGFLDLYVGGYEVWPDKEFPDVVLLNEGGKQFVQHWKQQTILRARGITAADYDRDGDLDIYVSNYRLQPNSLLQNDGHAKFSNVANKLAVDGDGALGAWGHTIGSAWGDFDNDGNFDLFVGNFSHPPAYQDRPAFLKNLGKAQGFKFSDQSKLAGLRWQESYASPAVADYDNDGRLDLFFTTVYDGDKSVLYRNVGDWKFEDRSANSNVDKPKTYQAAWADFDNDGAVDLVTGGRLMRNMKLASEANHWLKVNLNPGPDSNAFGIGTEVRIQLGNETLLRQVEGGTGQGNQNDLGLHFGLGQYAADVKIQVRWADGKTTVCESGADKIVTVTKE
ncbi:MAG: hypothetical protein ACI814_005261 [Mariniblastus sp.]|jgi:hypothetical protein